MKRTRLGWVMLKCAAAGLAGMSIPWLMWLLEPHHQPWPWELGETAALLVVLTALTTTLAVRQTRKASSG